MKINRKHLALITILIISFTTGGVLTGVIIFRASYSDRESPYPDLTISSHHLDFKNLGFIVKNQGEENASSIEILVNIDSLSLNLYNNSLLPIELEIDEETEINLNLTDFYSYFSRGSTYSITISVDPKDLIREILETNNKLTLPYKYLPQAPSEQPPAYKLYSANTYAYNSTIDEFGYAIQLDGSQIVLEDSLNFSNGVLNGYHLINSTILNASTVIGPQIYVSLALNGEQNLTLRNIWNSHINVVLSDNSSVSLLNCSVNEIISMGDNEISLSNSTVYQFTTTGIEDGKVKLNCSNHSHIEDCWIQGPLEVNLEFSTFQSITTLFINPFNEEISYKITGKVYNCTIESLTSTGQSDWDIFGTDINQVNLTGNARAEFQNCSIYVLSTMLTARAVLRESNISSKLQYGIIISSGEVNITNGEIQGSYINSTHLINSTVSSSSLNNIVVNGTGQLRVSNFSINVFLYDAAKLLINDTAMKSTSEYGCYLQDTSEATMINSTIDFAFSVGDSKLYIDGNSTVNSAMINSSNVVKIQNSNIKYLSMISDFQNGQTAEIINCTIEELHLYPTQKVNVTNSTMISLYEGIKLESNNIEISPAGIFGPGTYTNNLEFNNSVVLNQSYRYIFINGDINVTIEDLDNEFVIEIANGSLTLFNSTLGSIQMRHGSEITLNNCSYPGLEGGFISSVALFFAMGQQAATCHDNSRLYITNGTTIHHTKYIVLQNYSEVIIEDSITGIISIYSEAQLIISESEIYQIQLSGHRIDAYSLELYHCTIDNLKTSSWE